MAISAFFMFMLELTNLVLGRLSTSPAVGGIIELEGIGAQYTRHRVLKVPRCLECGKRGVTRIPWDVKGGSR